MVATAQGSSGRFTRLPQPVGPNRRFQTVAPKCPQTGKFANIGVHRAASCEGQLRGAFVWTGPGSKPPFEPLGSRLRAPISSHRSASRFCPLTSPRLYRFSPLKTSHGSPFFALFPLVFPRWGNCGERRWRRGTWWGVPEGLPGVSAARQAAAQQSPDRFDDPVGGDVDFGFGGGRTDAES